MLKAEIIVFLNIIDFELNRVLEENMNKLSDENERLKKELNELRSSGMSF